MCLQTVLKIHEQTSLPHTHISIIYTTLLYNLLIIITNTHLNLDVIYLKVQFIFTIVTGLLFTGFTHRHGAT
jgi:hypothetical protein